MGPILLQTPPKLEFEEEVASGFFAMLRGVHAGPVGIEPRNATWFGAAAEDVLRRFDIARVAADPARVEGAGVPGGSGSFRYHRLHGSPRTYYSAYGEEMLAATAEVLREEAQGGEVWCVFDNTASGAAAGNALRLRELVG